MANPIDQARKAVCLKELLEASKSAERLISALFEIGALDGRTVHEHLVPTGQEPLTGLSGLSGRRPSADNVRSESQARCLIEIP